MTDAVIETLRKLSSTTMIGAASAKFARKDADFYPTPPDATEALAEFIRLDPALRIWEPACGDGAISKVFEARNHVVYSSDLRVDSTIYGVEGVDFLKCPKLDVDFIVTNPPFNLAAEFITRCQIMQTPFAMLLKSQYWHASTRRALFERYRPSYVLPLTWRPNFAPERGESPTMDICWTVWLHDGQPCRYQPLGRSMKLALEQ